MKIVINPRYKELTSFIESIPAIFPNEGENIYMERNKIKCFRVNGQDISVKSFKIPHIINRIAYAYFRPSKAKRSYDYSLILEEKKIKTQAPIAYLEERSKGLFSSSYYVASFVDYPGLIREFAYHPLEEIKELVEAFALFTASIHEKGVLHLDYSPGNILYKETSTGYDFCLIDINRMKFGQIDLKTGCHNLCRLWGSEECIVFLATKYAEARGFDADKCVKLTLEYSNAFWRKEARPKGLKHT